MECARVCFLFLLLAWARCEDAEEVDERSIHVWSERKDSVASIREYPSRLHKCTGTFIRPDILLTVARCLICENQCSLFVHVLSDHLTDHGQSEQGRSYNIIETVIHPNYQRDPQMNDIGIVRTQEIVIGAPVFKLPTDLFDKRGVQVNTFLWQFTPDVKDYLATIKKGETISGAVCALVLERYIDYKHICMRPKRSTTLGPFDEGTPVVTEMNGEKVMLGLYTKEGRNAKRGIVVFDSLFPYLHWIHDIINCKLKCGLHYQVLRPAIPTGKEEESKYIEIEFEKDSDDKKANIAFEFEKSKKSHYERGSHHGPHYSGEGKAHKEFHGSAHFEKRPHSKSKIDYFLTSTNNDTMAANSPSEEPTKTVSVTEMSTAAADYNYEDEDELEPKTHQKKLKTRRSNMFRPRS